MPGDRILLDRARGALRGLAIGDALGAPADVHRSVRTPWVRARLWEASADLDRERVSRPLVPFSPTLSNTRGVVPTDDAEEAAAAALCLLAAADDDELFAAWLRHHAGDDAWLGVAARSAVKNAARGLTPPRTGNDNPASDDDAAVPAAVSFGIAHAADAASAAAAARRYARITHAGDGVDAAAFVASIVAGLLGGVALAEAVEAARTEVPPGTWLDAGLSDAGRIARESSSGFAAVPRLIHALSPRLYSHAGTAAETVPLAVAIALLADGDPERGIPLALAISRKADSLPAFVGALCGAARGLSALGPAWDELDLLHGLLLPTTAGVSLAALADRLVAHAPRPGDPSTATKETA